MKSTAQNHNRELILHQVESNEKLAEVVKDEIEGQERNPAHFCFGCNKYLGFRGFCSTKCHNEFYGELLK